MHIGYVIFDGMTSLDFIGFYDAVGRLKTMGVLPEFRASIVARTPEVKDDRGLWMRATARPAALKGFDVLFLPGGMATRKLQREQPYLDWLATGEATPLKVSVCTGALLWGALGYLKGKRATTHPSAYEELRPYCATVVTDQRVVDEGAIITARGVSTSIDLGLYLCQRLAGADARRKIQTQMDYPYGE